MTGWSRFTSSAARATVLTPIARSISTFFRRLSAYCGATMLRNPVWVKTAGPPMSSGQSRKVGKLAQASRASHSFV
jgi:hypothetical protein